MNLWLLHKNQSGTVAQLSSELDPKVVARLKDMGIDNGQQIRCIRHSAMSGPRIYQVGGSAFALEQEIASAIQLTLSEQS